MEDEMQADLRTTIAELIREDECGECLRGQAAKLEMFLGNIELFRADEKKLCIFTALTILSAAEEARQRRVRSIGERKRYNYYLPFVGRVCKASFLKCFGVSAATLARYKRTISRGWLLEDVGEE